TTGSQPERYIFDAWALMAYFMAQPEAEVVRRYLGRASRQQILIYASVINLGETYYMTWRKQSRMVADQAMEIAAKLPIMFIPVTLERALRVAKIKGQYSTAKRSLSYADSMAVALAEEFNASVLTGDPEFQQVETLVKVIWLREVKEP